MSETKVSLESLVNDSGVTKAGWDYILSLSKTVAFRFYHSDKDLISLSVMDLASFLLSLYKGDNKPISLRNVLFTRSRNCMSNHLYHYRKLTPVEDELLDTKASKEYEADPIDLPFDYTFSTVEEAHTLSLKMWRYYAGTWETSDSCDTYKEREGAVI